MERTRRISKVTSIGSDESGTFEVWIGTSHVADLIDTGGGSKSGWELVYASEWEDSPSAFALSPALPLGRRHGGAVVSNFFENYLPEGEELQELRSQPFVREVGALTPADYRITGSVGMGGVNLSTYLFFESVPDRFLDVEAADWDYEPGSRDIPIIIPRNYVNLYNYGFAPSQGLPQISEGIFRRVSLGIDIAGNGLTEHFRGRIVGLSNRLNTILVPDAFIRWSNGRFGSRTDEKRPARVIVETDRPVDAAVSEYLARKGYEAEGDRRDDGKATRFLRLAAGGVAGVGMAFSAMSFYVLMLSIFLLLQKNTTKLESLLLIGYSPNKVALPYQLLTVGLNVIVLGYRCVDLLSGRTDGCGYCSP